MASGWNLWVWLQCIGVASRCCCKEVKNYLIISVIKNVERASTARARESRDFHVRGTESGPNDV